MNLLFFFLWLPREREVAALVCILPSSIEENRNLTPLQLRLFIYAKILLLHEQKEYVVCTFIKNCHEQRKLFLW